MVVVTYSYFVFTAPCIIRNKEFLMKCPANHLRLSKTLEEFIGSISTSFSEFSLSKFVHHDTTSSIQQQQTAKGIELTTASCKIVHMELLGLQGQVYGNHWSNKMTKKQEAGARFLVEYTGPSTYNKRLAVLQIICLGLIHSSFFIIQGS